MPIHLAVLVSGAGSNLKAILEAIACGQLNAKVEVVLSNNDDAAALEIARRFNIPAIAISCQGLGRQEHEKQLLAKLTPYPIDYVVLAGYMRVLTKDFLQNFQNSNGTYRVTNIHPSLLPAFAGAKGYEDAFTSRAAVSGVTR